MAVVDKRFVEALSKKLDPDAIQSNLVRAGLFLAGWEMLKSEIENKVRDFFSYGFDSNGPLYSPRYKTDVLSRHESQFQASLPGSSNRMRYRKREPHAFGRCATIETKSPMNCGRS
jgi:hypothetical protein